MFGIWGPKWSPYASSNHFNGRPTVSTTHAFTTPLPTPLLRQAVTAPKQVHGQAYSVHYSRLHRASTDAIAETGRHRPKIDSWAGPQQGLLCNLSLGAAVVVSPSWGGGVVAPYRYDDLSPCLSKCRTQWLRRGTTGEGSTWRLHYGVRHRRDASIGCAGVPQHPTRPGVTGK